MIAGVLGVISFVLVLFCAGALAESNVAKAVKFGGAFVACAILILMVGGAPQSTSFQKCYTDWDGFSNPEVCN